LLGIPREVLLKGTREPPPNMDRISPEQLSDENFEKIYQYLLSLEKAG